MITHILNDQEKNEFKSIISFLYSKDYETIELGLSLLREYPYTMISEFCSFLDPKMHYIGHFVERRIINRIISLLTDILEDGKYCYIDNISKYDRYGNLS